MQGHTYSIVNREMKNVGQTKLLEVTAIEKLFCFDNVKDSDSLYFFLMESHKKRTKNKK